MTLLCRPRALLAARAHAVRRRRAPRQGRDVPRARRADAARRNGHRPRAPHRADRALRCDARRRAGRPAARARRPRGRARRGGRGVARARTAASAIVLVRGNHDAHAGDPPPALGRSNVVADPYAMPPFLACHAPVSPPSGYALCGHVHPGVRAPRLRRGNRAAAMLRARRSGTRSCRPSGASRALRWWRRRRELRIVAIAGSTLFALPRPRARRRRGRASKRAVAKLQRSLRRSSADKMPRAVDKLWIAGGKVVNMPRKARRTLFLLPFSRPSSVHQIALALADATHYALCSARTSTQDIVDFDLTSRNRHPPGRHRPRGSAPQRARRRAGTRQSASARHCAESARPGKSVICPSNHTQRQDFDRRNTPMQIASAAPQPSPLRATARPDRGRAWQSGREWRRSPLRAVQGDPPQRRGGRLRAVEDHHRDDQGVPRRQRRPGRGVARACATRSTKLTDGVVAALMKRKPEGGAIHIEEIQDQVELALMRGGEHEVARAYVLYREKPLAGARARKGAEARQAARARRSPSSRTACRSRSTSSG